MFFSKICDGPDHKERASILVPVLGLLKKRALRLVIVIGLLMALSYIAAFNSVITNERIVSELVNLFDDFTPLLTRKQIFFF